METEKCDKCGVEVEKGTLIRDQSFDASQLRCNVCIAPDKPKKTRKPRKKKEVPVIAPSPTIEMAAAKFLENPPPPVDLVKLRQDAAQWAGECGLLNAVAGVGVREDYPRYGFGYVFHINGKTRSGKDCMGTARYTCRGERSFWTIDGMVTG